MNHVSREIMTIDVMNFNFNYKYYNRPMNYSTKPYALELLRHLCNAVKNPAKNQKVRPARKLTALSCDVTPLHHLTLVSLTCLRYQCRMWGGESTLGRRVAPCLSGGQIRQGQGRLSNVIQRVGSGRTGRNAGFVSKRSSGNVNAKGRRAPSEMEKGLRAAVVPAHCGGEKLCP